MKCRGIHRSVIGTAVLATLLATCMTAVAQDALGEPIPISSIEELQQIGIDPGYPLNGHYVLTQNIDASDTVNWNAGLGFAPIGVGVSYGFRGVFDGQGYVITGLFINRPLEWSIGLFSETARSATIRNVGLVANNVAGQGYVGGLAGRNSGMISACYTTGIVTLGEGAGVSDYLGGLVGHNENGSIVQCYTSGAVTGSTYVGGLVGYAFNATITQCHASGAVEGVSNVGGLVGYTSNVAITQCHASGTVTGANDIGGLVGYNNNGVTTYSHASGAVTGTSGVGGLVGNSVNGAISRSHASGAVTGESGIGGLAGYNRYDTWHKSASNCKDNKNTYITATISDCYARGDASGIDYVGGLVGVNDGSLYACYSKGAVSGETDVGGLIGLNIGIVSACFWDTETSGQTVSDRGTGLPTARMMQKTTFTGAGWDFDRIWTIDEGTTYPYLLPAFTDSEPSAEVFVPNVVGMTLSEAQASLTTAGLTLGAVTQMSSHVPAGYTISQMPTAGATALPGATVSLVLSSGSRPARPEGFTASGALDRILMRWMPNTEEQVTGYRIERRASDADAFVPIASVEVGATRYEDSDVEPETLYHYRLAAMAGELSSDYAGPVFAAAGGLSLHFDDVELPAGTCSLIGLNVSDVSGVSITAIEISFTFDPTILNADSLAAYPTAITRGLNISVEVVSPGNAILRATSDAPFALIGQGRLFNVEICMQNDAPAGSCGTLIFTAADFVLADASTLTANLAGAGLACVSTVCGAPGDLNNDADITQEDANLVLDIAVRKVQANTCHWKTGELNGDGRIDCADAVIIMRRAQGNPIVPEAGDRTLADWWETALEDVNVVISLPYQTIVAPGEEIEMPVVITNANGLAGLDMTITFPPNTAGLTLNTHELGGLVSGFASRSLQGERFLRLSMASNIGVSTAKSTDASDLMLLRFRVAADATPGARLPITLAGAKLAGEFGEDFDWYTDVVLLGGTIIVGDKDTLEAIVELLLEQFDAADTDGDGKLTFDEARAITPGLTEEQFAEIDTDDDNLLSREELEAFLKNVSRRCGCLPSCRSGEPAPEAVKRLLADWLLIGLSLMVLLSATAAMSYESAHSQN